MPVSSAYALQINEIMYNPAGDDYSYEFIEFYLNESADISGFYFEGIDFAFPENTTLAGYILIANTCNENFTERYDVQCDFEYGGTLSNSGEQIILFSPDGGIVEQVNYSDTATENYSLETTSNGWLVSELEGGTPRNENSHPFFTSGETNGTINCTNSTNATDIINTTNMTVANNTQPDASIMIQIEKQNYSNGEQIRFRHILSNETEDYQIEYWIEDLFGEIVKSKRNTTNTNEKTYTPNIDEKDKILVIKSILYTGCNDSNQSNNMDEKLIFVVNPDYEEKETEKAETGAKTAEKKQPYISSFYTLTKNFEQNKTIKLFSYVTGTGSGLSLFFDQNDQLIAARNLTVHETERVDFEAVLQAGWNNFSIRLYENSIQISQKALAVYANQTEKNQSDVGKEKLINNTGLQPEVETEAETEAEKVVANSGKSIAYYMFLGLSVVVNAILIWKR